MPNPRFNWCLGHSSCIVKLQNSTGAVACSDSCAMQHNGRCTQRAWRHATATLVPNEAILVGIPTRLTSCLLFLFAARLERPSRLPDCSSSSELSPAPRPGLVPVAVPVPVPSITGRSPLLLSKLGIGPILDRKSAARADASITVALAFVCGGGFDGGGGGGSRAAEGAAE